MSFFRKVESRQQAPQMSTIHWIRPIEHSLLCILFIAGFKAAVAGEKDTLEALVFPAAIYSEPDRLNFLYDPDMTMRVGTEDILTVQYGLTRGEDKLTGTSWVPEQSMLGKSGGILLRAAKFVFLDGPVDGLLYLFQHEYFGHGGRIRELGVHHLVYHFNLPPPYGNGSASTGANLHGVTLSNPEYLSFYEGGIESVAMLNRSLALRWMAKDEINYRDAVLYYLSLSGNINYMNSAGNDLSKQGSDPELYLKTLNARFGFTDIKNLKMSVASFKSKMKISYANPFYYLSIYYFLKTYLWDGETSAHFPAFRFGQTRYLPVVRAGLTPFGPEYHIENYLRCGKTTSLVDIRIGDNTFAGSWGGIGISLFNIVAWKRYFTDLNVQIWTQPGLTLNGIPGAVKGGGLGGAFSIREYYDFASALDSFSAVIELGYKSVGFLEGHELDASPIFMIGLGYRL